MKKKNQIYIILSYIFFILPPFIWGLVEIYRNSSSIDVHIISLIVNLLLYVLLVSVLAVLILQKVIEFPSKQEQKHLLFGLIGNTTIYFYTFQNFMRIDDFITVYLILIIILSVYYILFSRKFNPLELWILAPTFLIIDTIHILYTGCGFVESYSCYYHSTPDTFLYILYSVIILLSIGYYIYKIVRLNAFSILKYINIALVTMISIVSQSFDFWDSKLIGTIFIATPFFIIIDFIVSIVNKTYSHKTLIFYIRTTVIMGIMVFVGSMDFLYGEAGYEFLGIMVAVIYSSLTINILSSILKVSTTKKGISWSTRISLIDNSDIDNELHLFDEIILIKENQLYFASYVNNEVSSYQLVETLETEHIKEAYLTPLSDELTKYIPIIETELKKLNYYQLKITSKQRLDFLLERYYIFIKEDNQYIYIKKI